jgi:hypothetical protein
VSDPRPALYLQEPQSRSILTVSTGPEEALTVSLQCGQVAVAMPLGREHVRALIATLDDYLYESRPT